MPMPEKLDTPTTLDDVAEDVENGFGEPCERKYTPDGELIQLGFRDTVRIELVYLDPKMINRPRFRLRRFGDDLSLTIAEFDPRYIAAFPISGVIADILGLW